jgi:hypothetical protein
VVSTWLTKAETNIVQTAADSLLPLLHSDSVTAFDPIANGLYTVVASSSVYNDAVIYGQLHAWAASTGGSLDPNVGVQGDSVADAVWRDTLYVGGSLPLGTAVTIQVKEFVSGNLQMSGNAGNYNIQQGIQLIDAADNLEGIADNNLFDKSGLFSVSRTLSFTEYVGDTLNLTEYLSVDTGGSRQWYHDTDGRKASLLGS